MRPNPPSSWSIALASLVSLALAACGGAPDEAELQKWAASEAGLQRLAQLVRDKEQPAALRVRALEIVVDKQQELRVRGMIELIPDQADREAIARQLVDTLARHVETRAPSQLAAKDAILLLKRYLPPEQLDRVQKTIADWAFADISWDTPAPELKSKLEARISAGQIADLGPYGLESAAILLANGFIAEQMVRYLSGSPAPAAKGLLIKAFRRFFPAFLNVNPFYLDAIRKTQDPAGAQLLFELYQDERFDQKSRDACFSVAAMMLDQPTIKGQVEAARPILAELVKIGSKKSAEDRWLAAANMLAITGGAGLGEALALFQDDKIYGDDPAANGNAIFDLCFELHADGKPELARPHLERALQDGNRIQQAIATLCAKTLAQSELKPALTSLAGLLDQKGDVSIQDFLGTATPAEGKSAPMTLGFLAKNAIEGIDLLVASDLPSLDAEKRKARHFVIVVEMRELGERYAKLIEERYQQSIADPK